MWSIGVILFELLTGNKPFFDIDDNTESLFERINNVTYDKNKISALTDEGQDFINKLLVADPKIRLSATEALKHPWITRMSDLSSQHNDLSEAHSHIKVGALKKQKSNIPRKAGLMDFLFSKEPSLLESS
jgi:serine/threonine protein kinase